MDGVDHAGDDVSALLQAWSQGHVEARDRVMEVVYRELRRRAAAYLRRERAGHTLQPTALGARGLSPVGRSERGRVAESRAVLRCRVADHAPHPGGPCASAEDGEAVRPVGTCDAR